MKYGYARVSTDDQSPALQLAALKRAGCKTIFKDEGLSGATAKRPPLLRCLKTLQPGDMLTAWKLDRLGRSLRYLITMLDDLRARNVKFQSLTEAIDTTTPTGCAMWQMIGVLAELERSLIIERTQAGMKEARRRGVKFGRKKKLSPGTGRQGAKANRGRRTGRRRGRTLERGPDDALPGACGIIPNMSDVWTVFDDYWNLYAQAFALPFQANALFSSFATNTAITGAYAEAYIRSMIKSVLGQRFRISTGAVIRSQDKTRGLVSVPQCDVIVWDPSELPAIFECGEFALVPLFSVRAIIEVKRTGTKSEREVLTQQLKDRQSLLPTMSDMQFVLGVLVNDDDPQPWFNEERKPSPNWLEDYSLNNPGKPPVTRLLHNNKPDTNGIMAFIYFLAQVALRKKWLGT